jgi:isopentenyldiphosphate isomerase
MRKIFEKKYQEELGVEDIELTTGPKKFVDGKHRFFDQIFFGVTDRSEDDFQIQKEEVEKVQWMPEENFLKEVKEKPEKYISSVNIMLEAIYDNE